MDVSPAPLYLLDTPILVHYIRHDALMRAMEATYGLLATPMALISVVTEGEIRALSIRLGWGEPRRRVLQDLLDFLTIVPIPFADVVTAYAEIDAFSVRNGVAIGKNDLWIAATARVTGATLLTTDADFDILDPNFIQHVRIDPSLGRS